MAQIWITPTLILQNTGSSTDLKTKFLVTRYPTSFINNMISLEVKFCKILRISLCNNAFTPKNIHRKKLKNSKTISFFFVSEMFITKHVLNRWYNMTHVWKAILHINLCHIWLQFQIDSRKSPTDFAAYTTPGTTPLMLSY